MLRSRSAGGSTAPKPAMVTNRRSLFAAAALSALPAFAAGFSVGLSSVLTSGCGGKSDGRADDLDKLRRYAQGRSHHPTAVGEDSARRPGPEARRPASNLVGRMIDAREVAYVVTFLASPKSVAIDGDTIAAGGGVPRVIYY